MIHHPYLEITLSTKPLGLEEKRDVTLQYVVTRRKKSRESKTKADKDTDIANTDALEDVAGEKEVPLEQQLAAVTPGVDKQSRLEHTASKAIIGGQVKAKKPGVSAKRPSKRKAGTQEEKFAKRRKASTTGT